MTDSFHSEGPPEGWSGSEGGLLRLAARERLIVEAARGHPVLLEREHAVEQYEHRNQGE